VVRSVKVAPIFEYGVLERFWRDADDLGFHAVWDYDHFYGLGDPKAPTLEGWTTLAAMAAVTSRIRIGCMVTGVTYRHPAVLASMGATVDHISGGRLEFGIGAAWHEAEHRAYGMEFPPAATRIDMLDEACQIIRRMWTEDKVDHAGRFWTLTDAMANPKPVQTHVPMLLGGSGERRTLRVVARRADEWNYSGAREPEVGPDEFGRLSKILDQHCEAAGRDPSTIRRSLQLFLQPDDQDQVKQQLDRLEEYAAHGAGHVIFTFLNVPTRDLLESLAPG
jgi:F420-dependent oxidoreductase-like protein